VQSRDIDRCLANLLTTAATIRRGAFNALPDASMGHLNWPAARDTDNPHLLPLLSLRKHYGISIAVPMGSLARAKEALLR
jgi:hypothetical protein